MQWTSFQPAIGKSILIADDHHLARRGIRHLIETEPGFQVVAEASDGRKALDLALAKWPDIAILDLSLPGLNGLDLTTALRRALPATEILIHTAHGREDIIVAVLRAGARAFVLKSDPEQELLAAVRALAKRQAYIAPQVSAALLVHHFASLRVDTSSLSHREREILQLVAEGKLSKQIGGMLQISLKTVETHRAVIMRKLGLHSLADLVRYAIRNDIIRA